MKLQFSVRTLIRELEDVTGETFSYARLGVMADVDKRYISAWDQGEASSIKLEHLEKFFVFLHSKGVDTSKHCTLVLSKESDSHVDKSTN